MLDVFTGRGHWLLHKKPTFSSKEVKCKNEKEDAEISYWQVKNATKKEHTSRQTSGTYNRRSEGSLKPFEGIYASSLA